MKHFSKKLISLFAVLCLLAALVIPSGIFAVSAEESQDTSPVYEFKFSEYDYMANGQTPYFGRRLDLKAVEKDKNYTLSFDYQIMGDTFLKVTNAYHSKSVAAGSLIGESDTQNYVKITGSGKFTYDLGPTTDFDAANGIGLHFEMDMNGGEDGFVDFKIWNLSLTEKGSDVNLLNANNVIDAYGVAYPDRHDFVHVTPDDSMPDDDDDTSGDTGSDTGSDTSAIGPVYKFKFSEYDWEENDYKAYFGRRLDLKAVEKDKNYTLSFDYFIMGDTFVKVYNAGHNHAGGAGSLIGESATKKLIQITGSGKFTYDLGPTTAWDVTNGIGLQLEMNMDGGKDGFVDVYIWNLSLVEEGTDVNLLNANNVLDIYEISYPDRYDYVDIMPEGFDPSTLTPGGDDDTSVNGPVYKFLHGQYDWEEYDYFNYVHHWTSIPLEDLTAGTNVTFSFDYFAEKPTHLIVANQHNAWAKENKGTRFRFDIEEELEGTMSVTFPLTENDLIQGYIGILLEQYEADCYTDFYIWNISITAEGSDENIVKFPLVWDGLVTLAEVMPADFDPSTLVRGSDDEEGEDDDFDYDDDYNTDDDNTGSDNTGSDNTGDDNSRGDEESGIKVTYEDKDAAFDKEAALYVSQYEDGDLDDALLELIGDKKYVAYDILLALGEDVVDLDGTVSLMIPLPEDFDEDATVIYATNAYGELVEIEFTVEDGYIVLSTDVLGTFVVVEGELDLAGDGADDKQDAPVVDDGKDDAKDDGKDDAKDDANDSDDADDKVDSDSPVTGEAVGGVLFAALILAAAAAALVVSKKRTA